MSWEDHNARRNALKATIASDRAACKDTDLAGASATIEVSASLSLRCAANADEANPLNWQ